MHVVEGELLIVAAGQHPAPGVKNHHRLRAGFDLRVEIQGDALRQLIQQRMQRLRLGVHHLFNHGEGLAAAALHHVRSQRPWTTGKTDQRHFAFQFAANGAHGVHYIAQLLLRIRDRQLVDVGFTFYRRGEARTFASFKVQPQPHGVRDGQDVRKEDRRVQRVTAQRLERHFAGQLGIFTQRHKVARLRTGGFVLR